MVILISSILEAGVVDYNYYLPLHNENTVYEGNENGDDIVYLIPELQLLSSCSGPPERLRPNGTQWKLFPNQGWIQTMWVNITPSTGMWGVRLTEKETYP